MQGLSRVCFLVCKSTSSSQVTIVAPSHQPVSCHPNSTKNHLGHPVRSKGTAAALNGLGQASGTGAAPKLDVLHPVGREEHRQVAATRSRRDATEGTSLVRRAYCLAEESWNILEHGGNTHCHHCHTSNAHNFLEAELSLRSGRHDWQRLPFRPSHPWGSAPLQPRGQGHSFFPSNPKTSVSCGWPQGHGSIAVRTDGHQDFTVLDKTNSFLGCCHISYQIRVPGQSDVELK